MPLPDLTVETFLALRDAFFNNDGSPKPFTLRKKGNTQDDPLDVYITEVLKARLNDAECQKSSGPLTSPDFVIYRRNECEDVPRNSLSGDLSKMVAVEVKKLERSNGRIARPTGMDYNTTPPCGTVRIYDLEDRPINVRGFYLFVCQEQTEKEEFIISSLTLCDGNILNDDFDLWVR
ncbi:MAG: hypothetical protein M1379_03295 [Firmicutes bacterium]|nr:hypothetical protein [Bacillota bacterium]